MKKEDCLPINRQAVLREEKEIIFMKEKNRCGLTIIVGIITSIITVASIVVAGLWLLDRKKKREDRELEEYLEASIN